MAASTSPNEGSALERYFHIRERGSTVRTEVLGGVVTFLTMAYIVFVNPAILGAAGLPVDAVTVATALGAALFTAIMGLATNLPFALAAGLGINAVVAFDLILGRELPWQVAMACIVIEGVVAIILVLAGLREAIMRAVPHEIKLSIGVGIGLFITLVGLRDAGITVNNPATGIGLGVLTNGAPLIALAGLLVMIVLTARGFRGAILVGILVSAALGLIFGVLDTPDEIARLPKGDDFSTIGDALAPDNLLDALTWALIPVIFVLFVTDFFDTIGTAVAVSRAGDLLDEKGDPPKLKNLLLVDSIAAAGGGVLGTSSNTTYVESGAGVAEGARTGLASLVTAGCFVLTIFFVPLIAVVAQTVLIGPEGAQQETHPAVAPALIMIGFLMIRLVADVDWSRPEAAIPAFLVIAGVPLTFSIAAGIGLGVLGYVAVMASTGRARQVHPLMWALVPLFLAFFTNQWLSEHIF
ncbi:AGZA family xanthine/uracil permease-like MFS transporter [Solirubrobacter pauli]|uniref:AGZA family xanthine/uracil permease-like MFS transporter n=1 Tax=Solirubrobacter pauli TaxID=166793 RepID=A0A660LCK1_9ACTN|nr:NCS2 family permease [Solirubrobacter pauli]RKQ90774.1 AGZA family xanthine/uracil permease-like MFS transporter [Solirubrobacter pauli]